MEEQPSICREAANILNKQSRTAERGDPPTWGLGEVLTTPHHKNVFLLQNAYKSFGPGLILCYDLSNGKGT